VPDLSKLIDTIPTEELLGIFTTEKPRHPYGCNVGGMKPAAWDSNEVFCPTCFYVMRKEPETNKLVHYPPTPEGISKALRLHFRVVTRPFRKEAFPTDYAS